MKRFTKRLLAFIIAFGFSFNLNLFGEIKEVYASEIHYSGDWIDRETLNAAINGIYTGGLPNVFQVIDWETEEKHSPYVYFTRSKTTSSNVNHNVHRTIAIQISRIKDDVDPFSSPYSSFKSQGNPTNSSDPHYYIEVNKNSQYYDDPWEAITIGGKTYSRQYFTIPLDENSVAEMGITTYSGHAGGDTINAWYIPYDTMWNMIKYSYGCDGWYESLKAKEEAGEPYYLGVDNVKTWVHLGSNANSTSDDTIHAKFMITTLNSNTQTYWVDYYNYSSSLAVWTWANWETAVSGSGSGLNSSMIKDYYNKYYRSMILTDDIELPAETPTKTEGTFNLTKNENDDGEKTTYTGNTAGSNTTTDQSGNAYSSPGIFTYNDSDKYVLGTAIPTSNNYTNGVILDGWYGNVELTQTTYTRTEKTSNYVINYTYTIRHHDFIGFDDETGEPEYDDWDEYKDVTEYATSADTIQSTWQGTYTSITNVDLYQLQSATTTNDAGGTVSYTDVLTHVPYSITVNGTTYTSGGNQDGSDDSLVPSFVSSESYHVTNNDVDTSRISVSLGNVGSSALSHDEAISRGKGQVQYIWNSRVKNNSSLVNLQNDEFTVDGVTYLTNPATVTQDTSGIWQKGGNVNWTYEKDKTHEMSETATNNIKQAQGEAYIPSTVINGYYYTNISATYKSFINSKNQTVSMSIKDNLGDNTSGTVHNELNNSSKPAIIRTGSISYAYAKSNYDYTINEPVVVHTPVIAPIHIADGETKTQLADNSGMSLSQLILDHEYTINFDWQSYFTDLNHYKGYEAPAGWTQYIEEKYVAFPFSVKVNGTYYDLLANGYTDWIPVGSTTTSFTFYIPSWSQEGLYYDPSGTVFNTWNSYARPIKVRVEAENMGSFVDNEQVEYNGDKGNYIATFTYPCQVSGIIYDFQVVSVRDSMNFATSDWVDRTGKDIYNFVIESGNTAKLQAEKNVGQNNRLGLPYMRYTLDGDMTDSWSYENTLPFASGKSVYGTDAGYLVRGNTIAFTIKTIANLTGENDYIRITPNYRYYASDGTLYDTDDIDIYYLAGSSLVKMGSTQDYSRMKPNYLYTNGGSSWYEGCYFDYYYDTFTSTAEHKAELWSDSDITENFVKLGHMEESYCVGDIKLDQSLCLWTGNEEELSTNIHSVNSADTALRYNDSLNGVVNTNEIAELSGYVGLNYFNKTKADGSGYGDYDDYWAFESSMQTWYGKYTIPSQIYVCPKGALEDYIENEVDYIDFSEDFWLPDDGQLVLNFDITSYMDGHEHLDYSGPASSQYDMWTNEHGNDPAYPEYRPGDVGIIELKYQSVRDHYSVGTLYIN